MNIINYDKEYLRTTMGAFSQKNWASGWMEDLDVDCQNLINGDRSMQFLVTDEDLDLLKIILSWFHSRVHGWWVWIGDAPIFMSDSEVKAFRSIRAEEFSGYNSGDIENLIDDEKFVVLNSQDKQPTLEFTDKQGIKRIVKQNQWVIREDSGKIIVLDTADFLEYIKTKSEADNGR